MAGMAGNGNDRDGRDAEMAGMAGMAGIAGIPGIPVLLDPVWISVTPAEPAQAAGKPGTLPDPSQLQNCIIKPSVDTGECSPDFNYQTEWATELPLHRHLALTILHVLFHFSYNKAFLPPSFPLWN